MDNDGRQWTTEQGEYALQVEPKAWRRIERECLRAHPQETGGVLIGYYTEDRQTAVVTEASGPPRDSRHGKNWFIRGVAGLKKTLARRWIQPARTHYLGEWHYHPASELKPSPDDIDQMEQISEATNYCCREPIMVILGEARHGRRPARAFVFPRGRAHLEFWALQDEDEERNQRGPSV